MVRTSFAATPAFSSVPIIFPMRVVASAFAWARLRSCASTPMVTRAMSGATEMRPSPEACTVRSEFCAGSGEAWARSRAAANAEIMGPPVLRVVWFQRAGARDDPTQRRLHRLELDLEPAGRSREELSRGRRQVLLLHRPIEATEHPRREGLEHERGQRLARTTVALGVDATTVRDPGLLLPIGRVQPAVGIEAPRVGIDAAVEQRGTDAAHRLVPLGNAHAVEGALAHHLAEEGDRQHRRDPARFLAHAVQVLEPANRSDVQRTRRGLAPDLLARAGADVRVASEALCEEREAADHRGVRAEKVEGLDAHLVAAELVATVARAEQAGEHVLAGAALVLVDGAVDEAEQELARLERARERREGQAQRQGENAGGEAIEGGLDRKSSRLNSSHSQISYAVFCLKKKKSER